MHRRQTVPRQWLVVDERPGDELWSAVRRLPRGSGLLVLCRGLPQGKRARLLARLRRLSRARQLTIVDEANGTAARVHDQREVRRAGTAGTPILFLSPLFPTRSHPDWRPLGRLRAAALMRLTDRPVIALGGMDRQRFAKVERLGFSGWAGIDAWIRT